VGVGIAVTLLGALGGWWAVDRFFGSGYDFPEAIAGVELTEAGDASQLPMVAPSGLEGEVAVYGPPMTPDYALLVLTLPGGDIDRYWEATADFWEVDEGPGKAGTARFFCTDNPVLDSGSMCAWVIDELLIELDAPFLPVSQLRPTAVELHAQGARLVTR
jgi:hypothetical protein